MVSVKRPEVAQRIHDAKEHGDLTRERRVRGRQERAGVRRGPDPDAPGADQERHDHRREPLDRPRPDRLDGRRSRATTARSRSRSSARPRPSRPRAGSATRARSAGRCSARRRARRSSSRSRPATSPTRSSHQLGRPTARRPRIRRTRRGRGAGHGLGRRARGQRQRARRSSTTRRRRRGPSTSAASAGPVILDVIVRALRARGLETTLLYGVDDLDPMDAQALLTPDAVEREMGRPLAHVPDQVGDGHASYARHHARLFIDIFAGLGIHPDRYYWMSDIYPTGRDGPVHPHGARPGGDGPRDLPPRRQRPAPRRRGIRSRSSARTAARSGRRS